MICADEKKLAEKKAIRRASHRCPVIKQCNKTLDALDNKKVYDIAFAIDILIDDLKDMPEAEATVCLLRRLVKYQ